MATPSGSDVIDGIFRTPPVVDVAKGLIDYVLTAVKGSDDRLPIPEQVTADNGLEVKSNSKHTPGDLP
jgi:filamentous hemagglutinin